MSGSGSIQEAGDPHEMQEHPARRQAVGEMHLRRWPGISVPCLIIQWLRIADENERTAQREILIEQAPDSPASSAGPRHLAGRLSKHVRFVWESHSEASNLTFFVEGIDISVFGNPYGLPELSAAMAMAERLPGQIMRATRIWIAPDEAAAEEVVALTDFVGTDLVSCNVGDGVRLWSDFRIKQDGYGYLLIAANGLAAGDLSRLLQRVQELGNYRNLALISYPLAQSYWSRLNAVEDMLRDLARDQIRADVRDDDLLLRASELSLEMMSISTDTSYRMSATAAYAQLVEDRLAELSVLPITGYPSLVDFTQRRFLPAVRTCAAFTRRENQLSLRAAHFCSLLRTRIETRIENQNALLLASMERSAAMQVRLQQLVEGLSVVALSYYSLALLEKLFVGIESTVPHFHAHLVVAALTVPVIAAVWASIRHMKKHMFK